MMVTKITDLVGKLTQSMYVQLSRVALATRAPGVCTKNFTDSFFTEKEKILGVLYHKHLFL